MERNIEKIAKAQFLIPALQKEIDRCNKTIEKKLEDIRQFPIHGLEWADTLFEAGAKHGLFSLMKNYIEDLAARVDPKELKTEWTLDELRNLVKRSNFSYARALPRSTSPSSNLIEQHKAALFMSFVHESSYIDIGFFHDAQWNDPEWNEQYNKKVEAAKAKREAEEAVAKAKRQAEINAKRAATRARNKGLKVA